MFYLKVRDLVFEPIFGANWRQVLTILGIIFLILFSILLVFTIHLIVNNFKKNKQIKFLMDTLKTSDKDKSNLYLRSIDLEKLLEENKNKIIKLEDSIIEKEKDIQINNLKIRLILKEKNNIIKKLKQKLNSIK